MQTGRAPDGNAPLLPTAPAPRESVSHDSQVALLPYESCSLATPEGGGLLSAQLSANLSRSLYSGK